MTAARFVFLSPKYLKKTAPLKDTKRIAPCWAGRWCVLF